MTTADTSRKLFSDDELRATLDGRIRQLEAEREANLIANAEAEADPHVSDSDAGTFRRNIESIEARLAVVRERRTSLD
jgi:hypothetical protein